MDFPKAAPFEPGNVLLREWKGLFFFVLVSPSGYSEITYILNELPGLIFFSAFCLLAALWMNIVPRPRAFVRPGCPALRQSLLWGNAVVYAAQALIWLLYPTTPHVPSEVWSLLAAFLHASAFASVAVLLLLHGCTAAAQVESTSVRLAMRMRKLRELRYTMAACTALFTLRVCAITAAAIVSVAAPGALDSDIGAGDSVLMAAYYSCTELLPMLLVLGFQRHIPPTAPLSASSAYRVVHGRDDSALVSSDTSSALRPSFDPNLSLLSDDGSPAQRQRPAGYGSSAPSPSAAISIPVPPAAAAAGGGDALPSTPSTPKRNSSFVSSHAAMLSTGTTKQVRMFGNIKQPRHVGGGAFKLVDEAEGAPAAPTPLATPAKSAFAKSAIPSIGTALANRHASEPDAFQPSKAAQWTASGQVLLTWKQHTAPHSRRRNWRQQSAVTRTLSQLGSSLSVALGMSPQPIDSARSRLLPRSQSPSIQGEHATPVAPRGAAADSNSVALSIPRSNFAQGRGRQAVGVPSSVPSDDGFSLKDISPLKARALQSELQDASDSEE